MTDKDFVASFPATDTTSAQNVDLKPWRQLGDVVALQIVAAFQEVCAHLTPTSRLVRRGQLNKFRHFMSELGDAAPRSLELVTSELLVRFAAAIAPTETTRTKDWFIATSVVAHACKANSCPPPKYSRHPWAVVKERVQREPPPAPPAAPTPAEAKQTPASSKKSRALLLGMPTARVEHVGDTGLPRNVVPIAIEPSLSPRGTDRLEIFFPAKASDPAQIIDLTPWLKLGETLGRQVAEAFKTIFRISGNKSRNTGRTQLTKMRIFLDGLDSASTPDAVDQITAEQLLGFKSSLDMIPSVATRGKHWNLAMRVLEHACKAVGRKPPNYSKNPWPGAFKRTGTKTDVLTIEAVGAILRACILDMTTVIRDAEQTDYEGPTLPDLLPWIICLTFWTIFNPETVTGQRISEIRPDMLGRIAVIGRKGRSPRDQVASFPAKDDHICAPPRIISDMKRITTVVRQTLPPDQQDFLFVGRVREVWRSEVSAKPYYLVDGGMQTFYRAQFAKKHGLEPFSLQMIRASGGVIVNRLFGDDQRTAQALMNHLRIETTDAYVRRESLRSEELRLADQMEKRVRFVRTDGARDVRGQPLAPQSAATAGFVCSDPFDAPAILGQDGGFCAAYGACPTCPLASVDRRCPTSLTFVLRLRNQIRDAHDDPATNPHQWLRVWKPRMQALDNTWLPAFDADVHASAAAQIHDVSLVPLPHLGDV